MYLFFSKDAYSRLENDVASSGVEVDFDDYMPVPVTLCVKVDKAHSDPLFQKFPTKINVNVGRENSGVKLLTT